MNRDIHINILFKQHLFLSCRAQNESESRRLKQDIKRLQDTLQSQKTSSLKRSKGSNGLSVSVSPEAHNHHEINRLNLEVVSLRETYKCLEDKYQVSRIFSFFVANARYVHI